MDRASGRIVGVLLLAATGVGGWWLLADGGVQAPKGDAQGAAGAVGQESGVPAGGARRADPGPGVKQAPAVEVVVDEARGALLRADGLGRAGSRTPHVVEPGREGGLRCPDGRFLPLLNGVEAAPALLRAPEQGPLPPVVALLVDADGWDWYEHADGSITTTRPQFVTDAAGRRGVQVVTVHNAPGSGGQGSGGLGSGGLGPTELPPDIGPTRR